MLLLAVTLAWMEPYGVLPGPPESLNQWSILEARALLCIRCVIVALGGLGETPIQSSVLYVSASSDHIETKCNYQCYC